MSQCGKANVSPELDRKFARFSTGAPLRLCLSQYLGGFSEALPALSAVLLYRYNNACKIMCCTLFTVYKRLFTHKYLSITTPLQEETFCRHHSSYIYTDFGDKKGPTGTAWKLFNKMHSKVLHYRPVSRANIGRPNRCLWYRAWLNVEGTDSSLRRIQFFWDTHQPRPYPHVTLG
jgi:hypothetical protein